MPTYGTFVPYLWHFCAQRIAILRHRETVRPVWLKLPIRPERAEALSPGQRPGYNSNQQGAL